MTKRTMDPATGVKRCLAAAAVTLVFIGCIAACLAVRFQITGRASYREGRHSERQVVNRGDSPSEFRQVINSMWLKSGVFFSLGIISFLGYKKLDEHF